MNEKYAPLFEKITLGNGVELTNRFGMAPMLVFASNSDDTVGEADYAYWNLRNVCGNLLISGAMTVSENGHGMPNQLTAYGDFNMEGLTKLAGIMKAKGNKAIMQLHHAGRESVGTYQKFGYVVAPSAINFPFLQYVPRELTHEEILQIIDDYGETTRRAIEAGYDGVEIHGANHYLLQQFFSAYSNIRNDEWGGTFEKRMAFPLAVLRKVKEVVAEKGTKDFIVGYRISPEEVHGENVGYTVDDALVLIDKLIEEGIDYLHISSTGNDYDLMPSKGGCGKTLAKTIYDHVNKRTVVLAAGGINTPERALEALNSCDVCMLGRPVLIDPEFVVKLEEGREDEIHYSVENRLDEIAFPPILLAFWQMPGTPLAPLKGLNA